MKVSSFSRAVATYRAYLAGLANIDKLGKIDSVVKRRFIDKFLFVGGVDFYYHYCYNWKNRLMYVAKIVDGVSKQVTFFDIYNDTGDITEIFKDGRDGLERIYPQEKESNEIIHDH